MTKNRKHVAVALSLIVAAAVLHGYEHRVLSAETSEWLFFLWSMAPYIACLLILILSAESVHVISASAVALALDGLMHYSVVTSDNSTAVLGFVWMPLWNTIIFVPLAMWVTLIIIRRRRVQQNAL
jgi:hypothetical protein